MIASTSLRVLGPALSGIAAAIAMLASPSTRAADGLDQSVQQTQRLSAWLDANAAAVSPRYPLGLMWLVADERPIQARARDHLLQELARLRDWPGYRPGDVDRLLEFVQSMPVTGRVRTAAAEARWLEADPRRDPLLQPGDRILVPARPRTVAVLRADGRWCHVTHVEAAVAAHYLDRCSDDDAHVSDWAWVVQPDGRVQKAGVAPWNTTEPQQVAPGARIWAPPRGDDTSSPVDEALARWLSWQGAAADPLPPQPIHVLRVADTELRRGNSARARAADNGPTASDWGFVGLLQTPTARMREPGSFSLSFQRVWPYTQGNVFLQPLEPLEVGFRYTDVANKLYGSTALSGSQSYKDKSIDLKLRLWRENHIVPELAVGVLDMGGTGLFGSEYLVASKRWGAADFSLGLAWGYLGNRQDADNPLAVFGDGLKSRPGSSTLTGQGGTVGFSRMFRGPVGVFGGVQYRPSGWPLLIKAELDGNDYSREPQGNKQPQKWPVNLGLVYQPARSVDITLAFERGNKASVGIAFKVPLASLSAYKSLDAPAVPVSTQRPVQSPDPSRTLADIALQTGWQPEAITRDPRRFQVDFSGDYATYVGDRLDRTFSVLHRDAPASVETLEIRLRSLDEVQLTAQADRNAWVRSMTEPPRSNEAPEPWRIRQGVAPKDEPADPAVERYAPVTRRLGVRPAIDLIQTLGGPDGFVLYQLSAAARATLRLPAGWVANGHARLRLIDNYDRFRYDGPSQLPRVRTRMREYLTTSRVTLSSLTLSKSARLAGNHFYSVYGGYFEPMFGGVGAEWLYRQTGSRWAFGIDANRVRQRDFHQDLRWRDYQVNTGHATVYWDTGWNGIKASVAAGQYLAGDRGATVVLQKVFANGVSMAAFATKTNVSAARFGEGSFDKGLFVTIPFDAFLPRSSSLTAGFLWRPLTRDGGAIVARPAPLIGDTHWLDPEAMSYRSAPLPNDEVPPDDRVEPWTRQP